MSAHRDKLLAGITSVNRREFDARKDSEEASSEIGALVAGAADKRDAGTTSDSGSSVLPDQEDQSSDEEGLESVLRAQVTSKHASRHEIKSQIASCVARTERLRVIYAKVVKEINILEEVLNANYRRDPSAEQALPEDGQGTSIETKENG